MHISSAFILENYLSILQLLIKDFFWKQNIDLECAPSYGGKSKSYDLSALP